MRAIESDTRGNPSDSCGKILALSTVGSVFSLDGGEKTATPKSTDDENERVENNAMYQP